MFRDRIIGAITSASVVLDLGAGRGKCELLDFRSQAAKVCGVDCDPIVQTNPLLHEAKVMADSIPYPDNTFDVVFANCVLEHVESPASFFAEVGRVLKPGGRFFGKTPNRRHYMPLIAACTPHWFHRWYNARRGREVDDTFPTYYRVNNPGAAERVVNLSGLKLRNVELIEGRPEYLRLTWPTYLAGLLYERLVNSTRRLEKFRIVMIVDAQKPT